jgi:hypothetical protein
MSRPDWSCPGLVAALERWSRRDPAARRSAPAEPPRRPVEHRPGALGAWGPLVGQPCSPALQAPAEPTGLEPAVLVAAPVPAEPRRLEVDVPPSASVPAEPGPRPCPRCGKVRCFCRVRR